MSDPILDFNFKPGDTATLHYITQSGDEASSMVHVEDVVTFMGDKMYIINIPNRIYEKTDNDLPESFQNENYTKSGYTPGLAEPDELEWPTRTINVVGG